MKTTRYLVFTAFLFCSQAYAQFNYQRSWGTYFGDERFRYTDSAIDSQGNLYIAGKILLLGDAVSSLPVFTTASSYHPAYGGGDADGFIVKFNPAGAIVWGTFVGGEDVDQIDGIDIDSDDNVYLIGTTSSATNVATAGSYQVTYAGSGDFFLMKIMNTGVVIWSTYFGSEELEGYDVYTSTRAFMALGGDDFLNIAGLSLSDTMGTPGVFQPVQGNSTYIISQFDTANGNRIWATYYGVNTEISALNADAKSVYVSGRTFDVPPNGSYNTYYGTTGAHQPIPANASDVYLSKFNNMGEREWSTYYGGNKTEYVNSSSIALYDDKVYLSGKAPNYINNEISTVGFYQPTTNTFSNFIAQFNESGNRLFGTYNGDTSAGGGYGGSTASGVTIDTDGNFYNFGGTNIDLDITTTGAYQEQITNNAADVFVCKYDANGNKLWGTYYGGENIEGNVDFCPYANNFYIVGATTSEMSISTAGSYQPTKQGNSNIFITHFEPKPLSTPSFDNTGISLVPNPTTGIITIALKNSSTIIETITVTDVLGKTVQTNNVNNANTTVDLSHLSKGLYFVKIQAEGQVNTLKVIKE